MNPSTTRDDTGARGGSRYAQACECLLGAMSALPEEAELPAELVRAALLAISFSVRPATNGENLSPLSAAEALETLGQHRLRELAEGRSVAPWSPPDGLPADTEVTFGDFLENAQELATAEALESQDHDRCLADDAAGFVFYADYEISQSGLGLLSRREMGIAVLVSVGKTNQQIARALGLSHKTVETYLTRIFRKLDVCSRSEIATLIGRAHVGIDETGPNVENGRGAHAPTAAASSR